MNFHSVVLLLWAGLLSGTAVADPRISFDLNTGKAGQNVSFLSPLSGWSPLRMSEISSGNYQISVVRPWNPDLPYKFQVNGKTLLDPANPVHVSDGSGGQASLRKTGFQEDPLLQPKAGVPALERTDLQIRDPQGQDRTITVYSPTQSVSRGTRTATIYFLDGDAYLSWTGVLNLLPNLASLKKMPFVTAVFIAPKNRDTEYVMSEPYSDWMSTQVVPLVESKFNTGGDADHRLLIGASLSGLQSVYTAVRNPSVFGMAGSQSGSFWEQNGAVLKFLPGAAGHHLNFYLDVGTYESARMLEYTRQTYNLSIKEHFTAVTTSFPGTHDITCWRNRLQMILLHFFSGR